MDEEDPPQGTPDWLQPFTENQEDLETHVPAHPFGRENSDSEGDASEVETQKRKHSVKTHFPKDRICEGMKSRNNHQYAVVVQDHATQWIQSYPCKTKTSQETVKSPRKILEPSQKPEVNFY